MRTGLLAAAAALAALASTPPLPRRLLGRRRPPALTDTVARRLRARGEARRSRAVAAQLDLVAAELAAHVRAGRSLAQAIGDASGELPQPAASAMAAASAAVSLGARPDQALRDLCGGEDAGLLAAAVGLQSRVGGDLALLLEGLSDTLVERRAQRRAAQVATAQARTTGRMVSAMPVFGVLALRVVDRPGFDLLIGTWPGWTALAISAVLTLAGQRMIRRLGEVEP